MTPEQYHDIGTAIGEAEAAIEAEPEALVTIAHEEGVSRAHLVGEMVEYALARHGFVVTRDLRIAAAVTAHYEHPRGPAKAPPSTLRRLQ